MGQIKPVTRYELEHRVSRAVGAVADAAQIADNLQFDGAAADLDQIWQELLRVQRDILARRDRTLRRHPRPRSE